MLIELESVDIPDVAEEGDDAVAVSGVTAGVEEIVSSGFMAGKIGGPGVGMLNPESLEEGGTELAVFDKSVFGAGTVPCLAPDARPELGAATAFTLPAPAFEALASLVLRKGFNFVKPFLIAPPPACFAGGAAVGV